jgi:hypothetical protein
MVVVLTRVLLLTAYTLHRKLMRDHGGECTMHGEIRNICRSFVGKLEELKQIEKNMRK